MRSLSQPDALATFWKQKSAGTTYWRCTVPARHLPGVVNELTPFDITPDAAGEPHMPYQQGNTAIWQFAGNGTRATIMAWQQEQGLRVLVEVDDLYLTLPPHADQLGSEWQQEFARGGPGTDGDAHSVEAHHRIVGWADGIICSTERLAQHYREVNDYVFVCPNSVEPDDWPEPHQRDNTFRIGWAASYSHAADQHLVRRAMEWAAVQKGVEVYTLGYPAPWRGRINRMPWTESLRQYRRSLNNARLDVGICPVVPGKWPDCKSDVKALEVSMTGAFPVVSDVIPYADFHGPTLRCRTGKDWERAIRWCVQNQDEVRALGQQAREFVLAERTIDKSIGAWREAVACAYVRHL